MWNLRGKIRGYTRNSIMIEADIPEDLPIDVDVDIKIKKHSEKRSLNANSYFHVLNRELARKLNLSEAECKNELITSYGQVWYIDDNDTPWIYKTNAPPEFIRQQETIHMKLVKVSSDEDNAYFYRVYRETHTYNTAEMARLIEGTIQECKLQGIQTATHMELDKMYEEWGKIYEKQ